MLSNLINRLPEKEISSIAEYIAKNETKDFVLLLRNKYNIESALDVIETWIIYQDTNLDMKPIIPDTRM
ncbi:MAG TPA: hypothetical protein VFJ05_03745 [Nitrososphaeraceae archaeon]|nr:hypothetical protein [Nitrososphaeraceae archaeon]